jgi:NAD(P)-dependent dehydrogenase (short-subunit alcohol dehydrogenase family)
VTAPINARAGIPAGPVLRELLKRRAVHKRHGFSAQALPGWIDTDLTRRARAEINGLHERVLARTPAARWGAMDDFAGIAVFLASHASDFVTGAAVPVDGGFSVMG